LTSWSLISSGGTSSTNLETALSWHLSGGPQGVESFVAWSAVLTTLFWLEAIDTTWEASRVATVTSVSWGAGLFAVIDFITAGVAEGGVAWWAVLAFVTTVDLLVSIGGTFNAACSVVSGESSAAHLLAVFCSGGTVSFSSKVLLTWSAFCSACLILVCVGWTCIASGALSSRGLTQITHLEAIILGVSSEFSLGLVVPWAGVAGLSSRLRLVCMLWAGHAASSFRGGSEARGADL